MLAWNKHVGPDVLCVAVHRFTFEDVKVKGLLERISLDLDVLDPVINLFI